MQRGDDRDPIARPDGHAQLDVLAGIEVHTRLESFGKRVGEKPATAETDAVRRVADERVAGLDVAGLRFPERTREGDELVGGHRVGLGTIELATEDGAIECQRHARPER